jgi:Na+-driven multidrug efflux pump
VAAGIVTQRAMVISLLLCVPVILSWTQVDTLMVLLGQDPAIVHRAKRYLLMISPTLPIALFSNSVAKFQTTQVRAK